MYPIEFKVTVLLREACGNLGSDQTLAASDTNVRSRRHASLRPKARILVNQNGLEFLSSR